MSNEKSLNDVIDTLIGDTPISVQLAAALNKMSPKDHEHESYVSRKDFNDLKAQVEKLIDLIGDTSVAEQIDAAIKK